MGVAVSVSTSTCWRSCLMRSLCADAEALLFVDHEEAEVLEMHVLRQKPVRADDDLDFALLQREQGLAMLLVALEP